MSGAKFDGQKVPLDLLPPDALWEVAKVLAFGARKYESWNWYKGFKYSRLWAACLRHLYQWWRGHNTDKESGLSHLAHAGCMLLFLLQFTLEARTDDDDRPQFRSTEGFGGVTSDGEAHLPEVQHASVGRVNKEVK
jgi:hypothetical protein